MDKDHIFSYMLVHITNIYCSSHKRVQDRISKLVYKNSPRSIFIKYLSNHCRPQRLSDQHSIQSLLQVDLWKTWRENKFWKTSLSYWAVSFQFRDETAKSADTVYNYQQRQMHGSSTKNFFAVKTFSSDSEIRMVCIHLYMCQLLSRW